jgi:ubiquinone/menaquinone biosynthesis C-methylase UbiE
MFDKQYRYWQHRKKSLGDASVGRRGEDIHEQAARIARHLDATLGDLFVANGLDFGCGWGRFVELLSRRCRHLWVADLFVDWTERAARAAVTTTPVVLRAQRLPLEPASMDLVVDVMTIQSITSDVLARETMHELSRVARSGATVVSLHIVKPRAPTRTAANRAAQLRLSKWHDTVITNIDKAGDAYSLLVGTRV